MSLFGFRLHSALRTPSLAEAALKIPLAGTLNPAGCSVQIRGKRWKKKRKAPRTDLAPFTIDKEALAKPIHPDDDRLYLTIQAPPGKESPFFYKDPTLTKFTSMMMEGGNRQTVERIMRNAFELIKRKQLKRRREAATQVEKDSIVVNPLEIFHSAIKNCTPLLSLTPIGRGGITYMVPTSITSRYAKFTAMRWFKDTCRIKNKWIHMPESLAEEFIAASEQDGRVFRQKMELHKLCEQNRAYAAYRWSGRGGK